MCITPWIFAIRSAGKIVGFCQIRIPGSLYTEAVWLNLLYPIRGYLQSEVSEECEKNEVPATPLVKEMRWHLDEAQKYVTL